MHAQRRNMSSKESLTMTVIETITGVGVLESGVYHSTSAFALEHEGCERQSIK